MSATKFYITRCTPVGVGADLVVVELNERYATKLIRRIKAVGESDDVEEFSRMYKDGVALYVTSDGLDLTVDDLLEDMEVGKALATRSVGMVDEEDVDVGYLDESTIEIVNDSQMIQVSEGGVQWMACLKSDPDVTLKSKILPLQTLTDIVEDENDQ